MLPGVPTDYAAIKEALGDVVPCYGDPSGCCADDATNEKHCEDGCIMLRIYSAGFVAGQKST
jgi:hypothetical protein